MFFELTYTSKAIPNLDLNDVFLLQNESRELNGSKGITGCLVLHNNRFVGIVEGNEKKVRKLFSWIEKDRRHTDVKILSNEPIHQRQFNQWNMIFRIDMGDSKVGMSEQLFKDNLISLTHLVEKRTYTSRIFWNTVRELLEEE